MMICFKPSCSEQGFTLLELLLVIGVAAIVFLGITQITRSWVDSESASGAGQHLERVSRLTHKYIEARFATLTASDDVLADAAANPLSPWVDLRNTLQQEGLLTAAGNLRSPFNVPMQISYVIDNSVSPTVYRAAIFTTQNLPNKRVLQAARQAGNTGGTVTVTPTNPNPAMANDAIGAFGQWRIDVSRLMPSAAFPCPRTNMRGCLISLVSFNQDTLCGPYLYRDSIPACANANTMTTTLNMNNNDIVSAGSLDTQNLTVSDTASLGNTTVNGTAALNGPTTASRGMTVANGMTVSGTSNFSDNVNMVGGGTLNVTQMNASHVQAISVRSNRLEIDNMHVNNGTLTVDDDVNINNTLTVGGTAFVGTVNTGTVNANGGAMTVGTMDIRNQMNINGSVQMNGGANLTVDRLIAQRCVDIQTDKKYGICP